MAEAQGDFEALGDSIDYRAEKKGLYMVARYFILALLSFSA